jgi:hypothetical protein
VGKCWDKSCLDVALTSVHHSIAEKRKASPFAQEKPEGEKPSLGDDSSTLKTNLDHDDIHVNITILGKSLQRTLTISPNPSLNLDILCWLPSGQITGFFKFCISLKLSLKLY